MPPLLSIVCLTYNHENYIKDAIDSFLSQRANFEYEIVIHDDASSDKTAEIIKGYEKKFPQLICAMYEKENQYSTMSSKLFSQIVFPRCKGKYIAFCEGDDFWIDVNKIQKQVDFMEQNDECIMSVHNAYIMNYLNGDKKEMSLFGEDKDLLPDDIILRNIYIATSSMVFRHAAAQMEDFFYDVGVGDYTLLLNSLNKGKIHYFNNIMSQYRCGHEGSWQLRQMKNPLIHMKHCLSMIAFMQKYDKFTDKKYTKYIDGKIQLYANHIFAAYIKSDFKNFDKIKEMIECKEDDSAIYFAEDLKNIFLQTYDQKYLSNHTKSFIQKFEHIVIMGAGKYASLLTSQLIANNIVFDGYVVSEGKKCNYEYNSKKVWNMNEIPFEKNKLGLLIAINPELWDELFDSLKKSAIENYMCPFLLNYRKNTMIKGKQYDFID